jgi:hypothetical protein
MYCTQEQYSSLMNPPLANKNERPAAGFNCSNAAGTTSAENLDRSTIFHVKIGIAVIP